jgi:hypothetical protein
MGTCSTVIKRSLLANLLINYVDQVIVRKASIWDDNDLYYVIVESKKLPEGDNGSMDIIIDYLDVRFKPDLDV